MGLFADIQEQVSREAKQARLQSQQAEAPRPTPFPTPQPRDSTAAIPTPFPEPEQRPAPVVPQISPINSGNTAAAIQRIKKDTERITRRNMKDAVADYLAQSCSTNPDLARSVMAENKTMVKCFAYINRRAREYAEQERRDNNITDAIYGCDVPDDLVYQWAVTYFLDPNADKEPERKTLPKSAAKARSKVETKQQTPPSDGGEQMTLMEAV